MTEWRPQPGSEPLPDRERPFGEILKEFLVRNRSRLFWIFPVVLLGAYLGALSSSNPLGDFLARRSERRANAPLLAEARALNLGYEKVSADPAAAAGKPVVWCVGSNDGRSGFVDTRQIWPVVWTEPSEELKTNNGSHGYCWTMLAVVVGAEGGVVKLRPVEKL